MPLVFVYIFFSFLNQSVIFDVRDILSTCIFAFFLLPLLPQSYQMLLPSVTLLPRTRREALECFGHICSHSAACSPPPYISPQVHLTKVALIPLHPDPTTVTEETRE